MSRPTRSEVLSVCLILCDGTQILEFDWFVCQGNRKDGAVLNINLN